MWVSYLFVLLQHRGKNTQSGLHKKRKAEN